MGLRGQKPKGRIKIEWSANFAYAIGLIVTDGNLSGDRRHVIFVSKEIEQINNFVNCLGLQDLKVGRHISGYDGNLAHRVQFGDVLFYKFLSSIGLTPAKSKTIGKIEIPEKYFFDFLRGCFDGDGCSYSYWDPRWRSSFMMYVSFCSASYQHILWLREQIYEAITIKGHISKSKKTDYFQLKFAKKESEKLINKMYYSKKIVCLKRKKLKIDKALAIMRMQAEKYARVAKLEDAIA